MIYLRVLAESLLSSNTSGENPPPVEPLPAILPSLASGATGASDEETLRKAIELSKLEEERRRIQQLEEDEELRRIIELSLLEK